MCTYNGERYLRDQLASIAAQTRLPDELVVSDDHSTDATREIVTCFAASAPFPVRLHVNEQNVGSTKNFERAIRLCDGDVIALSDQDDVWLPEKLRRIEGCLLRNPRVGLVFTDAEVVDEELQPLGYSLWESIGFDKTQQRFARTARVLDVLLPGSTVAGATMAFRSGFKNLVLEIPTNLALLHDGWIALMIASVADVSFIEESLIKYRQHSRQQIGARKADEAGAAGLDGIKEAMRRTTSYKEMIEIATQAHHRLAEQRDIYKSDDALSRLEARLEHLRARSHLPEGKLSRVRCIIGELLSRRYHLYSNGFRSAVKDLLA
ncbi:MAG: glycosyltransferase family 2 protein [Acidobacteriota bacterium]|nr:glycosyltransferase family 2 protein [Acidobacteriota bacterium]